MHVSATGTGSGTSCGPRAVSPSSDAAVAGGRRSVDSTGTHRDARPARARTSRRSPNELTPLAKLALPRARARAPSQPSLAGRRRRLRVGGEARPGSRATRRRFPRQQEPRGRRREASGRDQLSRVHENSARSGSRRAVPSRRPPCPEGTTSPRRSTRGGSFAWRGDGHDDPGEEVRIGALSPSGAAGAERSARGSSRDAPSRRAATTPDETAAGRL